MPIPALRGLDIVPIEDKGKPLFVVRDNEGILEHSLVLPPLCFVVASLLDGTTELEDVQRLISERFPGQVIPLEDLRKVVDDLEQHGLLESDRVQERRRKMAEEFAGLQVRPASFAGLSYPKEGGALRTQIDGFHAADGGAGLPPDTGRDAVGNDGIPAILAPHIDFTRGGPCYTHPYRLIRERSAADLYVILGVAHVSPPNPFVVSPKDFDTPLGALRADREILDRLRRRMPSAFEYELVHKSEHSAEFQAVFLRYARSQGDFTILPILCSSFEPHCGGASPSTAPIVEEFILALREILAESGRRVCLVGGVDFAHVGPRFGDQVELNHELVEWMVAEDRKSLRKIEEGNAEGFWNSVMADGNRRHVCGLSATYALLRLLNGKGGRLLKYDYAPDPAGGFVSFAGVAFD